MKGALNLILLVVIVALVYMLIGSIREPIQFQEEKTKREEAVIGKLLSVRKAQELYRGVTGSYAGSFDELKSILTNGKFKLIKVTGDPDDPTGGAVSYDTIYRNAIDSVNALRLNLDSLGYVPYGGGAMFDIKADTLTYQNSLVNVVEVGVQKKVFMGAFGDKKFAKYDDAYDPNAVIKFGNMKSPNISGNWE